MRFKSLVVRAGIFSTSGFAQDGGTPDDSAAQANNPLASFTAFNIQNYYIPELTELPDNTANMLWLRYARPLGDWLVRASLPISNVPISQTMTDSGIGDLNAFAARIIDIGRPGATFGVGPQMTLDTANVFVEPQFTLLSKGAGQPKVQLFAGFNMQFKL